MKRILFISVLICCNFKVFSQKGETQIKKDTMSISEYTNYGINIYFKGSIDIIKNNVDEKKGYFYKAIEIIRFDENNKTIDYNSQHLISEFIPPFQPQSLVYTDVLNTNNDSINTKEDESFSSNEETSKMEIYSSLNNSFSYFNHLSSLYILPKMSVKKLKKEIESYVNNHSLYQITEKFTEINIGINKGYQLRIQNGKTRLDHYIFLGKEYNYLFVSSPYGSNGSIENVVLEMKIL